MKRQTTRTAALLIVLLGISPISRAQEKEPELIRTSAEMQTAITAQVAKFQKSVRDAERAKDALRRAIEPHKNKLKAIEPHWQHRADLEQKLVAMDQYLRTRELSEVGPELQPLEDELRRRKTLREAVGGAIPPDEARDRELLAQLKTAIATAQRDLPGLRPSFVPAGTEVAAFRVALANEQEQFEARVRPLEEELATLASALSAAISASSAANQDVVEARQRYLVLRYELQNRLAPVYLSEVKLRAPLDPRGEENVYYHAVVESETSAPLAADIAYLVTALPAVNDQVVRARGAFLEAERNFIAVSDRWQEKNAVYMARTEAEYAVHGVTEIAESMAALATEGFSPASVFFELGVRIKDVAAGERIIPEPTLNEELFAYRQRIAEAMPQPRAAPVPALPRRTLTFGPSEALRRRIAEQATLSVTAGDVASHQYDEAVEGLAGVAFGAFCDKIGKDVAKSALKDNMPAIMAAYAMEAGMSHEALREILENTVKRNAFRGAVTASPAEKFLERVSQPTTAKEIAKGFAVAAALSLTKDALRNMAGYTSERARLMTDMAILDIEWFVRRAEYQTSGQIYRRYLQMQREYKARIATQYEQQLTAPRTLRVIADKPFATSDQIQAELRFQGIAKDVEVRSAKSEYASSMHPHEDRAFIVPLSGGGVPAGQTRLDIKARGTVTSFDANPLTPPQYTGPTLERPAPTASLWSANIETGPDRLHKLRAEAPVLTLVDPASEPAYVVGDWVGVSYRLPGSLPHQRLRLSTATVGDDPVEIEVPAQLEGRLQFQLTGTPGFHTARLVRGPKESPTRIHGAKVTVRSVVPSTRQLPGAPFTKVTQTDLPTRGQWLEPQDRPIAAGMGRLFFEPRSSDSQLAAPKIEFSGPRSDFLWSREADVPPGNYTVRFHYTPNIVLENQRVAVGATTRLRVGQNYGRLGFRRFDGVGNEIDPKVEIRVAGSPTLLAQTWSSQIDLPAGSYDLFFHYTPSIEQKSVTITAGKLTMMEVGGYGRLEFASLDGESRPADPKKFIYRTGSTEEIWHGWGPQIDLPPGSYRVEFGGYFPPLVLENQLVVAGRATRATSSGYGRITTKFVDAAGTPQSPRRSLFRPGTQDMIWSGWEEPIDVQPGVWELRWSEGNEEHRKMVNVTAGKLTPYTIVLGTR